VLFSLPKESWRFMKIGGHLAAIVLFLSLLKGG
jgi:hypothetical protein